MTASSGAVTPGERAPAAAICLTGLEQSGAELCLRIAEHERREPPRTEDPRSAHPWNVGRVARRRVLHEIRLDALRPWDESVLDLCDRPDVVVCCRPAAEGGRFDGTERERRDVLARALRRGPGYLDIELSAGREALEALRSDRRAGTRIVVSAHRFEPISAAELGSLVERLRASPGDVLKLAVSLQDAADAVDLRDLMRDEARPVVVVGMGDAGLVSRLLPDSFGSAWTYVAAGQGEGTAPGQIDWQTARAWRLGDGAPLVPIGLVGGPVVLGSPGPWAYNAMFSALHWPYQYVPIVTDRPRDVLSLCEKLGFAGLSVTMPLKRAVHDALGRVEGLARRVGAVNTVLLGEGAAIGLNTDVTAVSDLLGPGGGRRLLVLGSGGAACAAVVGGLEAGWRVVLSARDPGRATELASRFEIEVLPWEARLLASFDGLVHATPVGRQGEGDPLDLEPLDRSDARWSGRLVLDMVMRGEPTRLVRAARMRGARVLDGLDMWFAQGAAQIGRMTRRAVDPQHLRRAWRSGAERGWQSHVRPARARRPAPEHERPADRLSLGGPGSPDGRRHGHGFASSAEDTGATAVGPSESAPLRIAVPGSKSQTQRALVCAALADGRSVLHRPLDCDDSRALRAALGSLGTSIVTERDRWVVDPAPLRAPDGALWCHDGGTTVRFLAPLGLVATGELRLDGSQRLRERPLGPLLVALRSLGLRVRTLAAPGHLPVALGWPEEARSGPPGQDGRSPRVVVDSSVSSQFASGLLLVAPRLDQGLTLELSSASVSRPYVELTVAVMRSFGAEVRADCDRFVVLPTGYRPTEIAIEADWSSAAMLLAAAFIRGRDVVLEGLDDRSIQPDRAIAEILRTLGEPGTHEHDLRHCPDLVAPVAAAAVVSPGRVVLRGIAHAREKESDRPAVLAAELARAGARISFGEGALVVEPGSRLAPCELDPHGDHRMAMAFGALSLREPAIRVLDLDCVTKSFPDYWRVLEQLR